MKLRVATCQFPTSGAPERNLVHVLDLLERAASSGVRVAHFPEGALSGYVAHDLESYDGYDWDRLRECAHRVAKRAGQLGLWVVIGSAHPLTPPHRPHNSLYVIDDHGASAPTSCWGSFFVRADGVVTGRLDRHATDVLVSVVDTEAPLYDSTQAWRDRAADGILHSGSLVEDERSIRRGGF